MKLEIPKPFTEIDITHADQCVVRTLNYTNDGYREVDNFKGLEFRQVILDDCKVEGLIPGATVVHKKIAKDRRMDIITWGVVFGFHAPNAILAVWKPIRVKWLSGSFEDCHASDLIVMNFVPDKSTLQERARRDRNPSPV